MIADIFGTAPFGRERTGRLAPTHRKSSETEEADEKISAMVQGFQRPGGSARETYRRMIAFVWVIAPECYAGMTFDEICDHAQFSRSQLRQEIKTVRALLGQKEEAAQ